MTAATTIAPTAIDDGSDPVLTVRVLSQMGLGHPVTIRNRIHELGVPTEILDGRGMLGVRKSNLHLLSKPGRIRPVDVPVATEPLMTTSDVDDLAALAARLVSTWPRLSDERKRELGALLATP